MNNLEAYALCQVWLKFLIIKGEKIHRHTEHQKGLNIGETRDGGENYEHAPSIRNYNNTLEKHYTFR